MNTRLEIPSETTRRLIHAFTGLFSALTPFLFRVPFWVYVLSALFVIGNLWALQKNWFKGMHGIDRKSLGTATFPLALLVALFLTWSQNPTRNFALHCAFLVLAFSDPMASYVGMRVARPHKYRVGAGFKTMEGSLAFGVSAFFLVLLGLWLYGFDQTAGWMALFMGALTAAGAATLAEALGTDGWDNFFIPIAVMVTLVFQYEHSGSAVYVLMALVVGVGFAFAAWKVQFLSESGALTTSLLAAALFGFGGYQWSLPGIVFFVLSSLWSKVGKRRKAAAEFRNEKGSRRDSGQVYANGGVAWALLILYVFLHEEWLFWGFVGAFAAAAADTWATEIGALSKGRTWLFPTFKPTQTGVSGGVSVLGTLGGLLGGASVWLSTYLSWDGAQRGWSAAIILVAATVAMFADSALGTFWQARYRERSGRVVERRTTNGEENEWVGGLKWLNNDRVNFLNTGVGALLSMLGYWLWISG